MSPILITSPESQTGATGLRYELWTLDGDLRWSESDNGIKLISTATSLDNGATPSQLRFRESNGGALHIEDVSPDLSDPFIGVANSDLVLGKLADAVAFHPEPVAGGVALKHFVDGAWRYVSLNAPTAHQPVGTVVSKPESYAWRLWPTDAPAGAAALWRQTYQFAAMYSPHGFLNHVRLIAQHKDAQHGGLDAQGNTGDGYWDGLDAIVPGTDIPYSESLVTKVNNWLTHFTASSDFLRQEANAALLRASAHFYNAPGPGNELDPRKPPEWSEVDDELGSGPYPG